MELLKALKTKEARVMKLIFLDPNQVLGIPTMPLSPIRRSWPPDDDTVETKPTTSGRRELWAQKKICLPSYGS